MWKIPHQDITDMIEQAAGNSLAVSFVAAIVLMLSDVSLAVVAVIFVMVYILIMFISIKLYMVIARRVRRIEKKDTYVKV